MPVEEVGFAGAVWIKTGRIDTVGVSAQADKGLPLRRERDRVDDEYRGRYRFDDKSGGRPVTSVSLPQGVELSGLSRSSSGFDVAPVHGNTAHSVKAR